ncbi:uncharacterized protein LOC110861712 [Folsomia candida]|uniref:uncharacterized protein LOC110861712 n=1 Tax=Folsomia candida TaxID=158441 RepID=UPI001605278C|nr:uncharacterized protein LOC110861712 [Folsomia candida]
MESDDYFDLLQPLVKKGEEKKKLKPAHVISISSTIQGIKKRLPVADKLARKAVMGVKEAAKVEEILPSGSVSSSAFGPRGQVSANHCGEIIRHDKIAKCHTFFFYLEKVTPFETVKFKPAGDLSIVDMHGRIVFHCFVLHRPGTIKNFHTEVTGVSAAKSAMGITLKMVRYYLTKYFSGKTLVGAATVGDLMALEYQEGEETPFRTEDVQDFSRDRLGSIRLADLAWHCLHRNVQEDAHSSVQDARLTLMAWKQMMAMKKAGVTTFSCPELEQMREDMANLVGLPEGEKKRVWAEQK